MKINGHQNLKYIKKKVLFCGRKNDKYSIKIIELLKKKNISLKFFLSDSKKKITKKEKNLIYLDNYDFIFSFRSHIIINIKKINKKCVSINFHPGPPNYRGIGCVNFALLNKEKYYGATAHIMNSIIDSGPILSVMKFRISNKISLEKILEKTYKLQFKQFKKITNELFKNKENIKNLLKKNKNIKWSKKLYLKKDLMKLYNLANYTKKYEVSDLLRATLTEKFKPYFKFKNMIFKL
jgi:methionyl-tRNA formyltransferase